MGVGAWEMALGKLGALEVPGVVGGRTWQLPLEWGFNAFRVLEAQFGRGACEMRTYDDEIRVHLIQNPCDCHGTGRYHGAGSVVNGTFVGFTGKCYRCQGKGWQTPADVKRNTYYDNHVRRISLR